MFRAEQAVLLYVGRDLNVFPLCAGEDSLGFTHQICLGLLFIYRYLKFLISNSH